MAIGGLSIILILGIVNLFLLIFQLLSGLHIIKIKIRIHKTTGILLVITAFFHALLAIVSHQ